MRMIRYGIIGAGAMGREHARNIALAEHAEVVAIADPHPASRAAAAELAPDARVYADYRELLASIASIASIAPTASGADEPIALVIATPNHTHRRVLDDALATRAHILVEKPLCTTVEDCRAVVAAAAGRAALVWVGLEYRYMPPVARLLEAAATGTVGPLHMVSVREHRHPFLVKVGDWNRFARNTGGTLVEKCCHFFDLMRLLMGAAPQRVYASGAQDINHLDERYAGAVPDIIDNAFVVVDFPDSRRALLDLCMFADASPYEQELTVVGTGGTLRCTIPDSELYIGRRRTTEQAGASSAALPPAPGTSATVQRVTVPVEPRLLAAGFHHGATYYEHLAFQRAIRAGTEAEVNANDGLLSVAMGAAAELSIAERRPVDMSELGL